MIEKLSKALSRFFRAKDIPLTESPLKIRVKYTKPKEGLPLTYFICCTAEVYRMEIMRAVEIWTAIGVEIQEVPNMGEAVLVFGAGEVFYPAVANYKKNFYEITGNPDVIAMRENLFMVDGINSFRVVPKCNFIFGRRRYNRKLAHNLRVEIFVHEVGHALGLADLHEVKDKKNIMYKVIQPPLFKDENNFIITPQQIHIALTLQEFGEEGLTMQDVDTRWISTL